MINTTAQPTNSTVTTTTQNGQTVHTATLNALPPAPMTAADKLRAKLTKATQPKADRANPITPKVMFEKLTEPGMIDSFIEAALNGEDKEPLVITASHVNRSECLKAAHAAIKFADMAAVHAPKYGLTAPEFTRLLTKLIIQDYNPAALEAEPEANATAQDTNALTQTTASTPTASEIEAGNKPIESKKETAKPTGKTKKA